MPRRNLTLIVPVFLAASFLSGGLYARQASPPQDAKKPPTDSSQTQQIQPANAPYDPLPAEKDVEVGTYYMHKGDVDAAIARYQDAIRLRSNFAKPRILLAEAYEKKGEKSNAVKYYKEYLQVYPDAPDAKKIRQKIEKLSR
jgi:tetratricopeptide (TPR) repeat protein